MNRWRLFTDKESVKRFAKRKKTNGVQVYISKETWIMNGEEIIKYRAEWEE